MAVEKYIGDKYTGLETDTKPTEVLSGSIFYELDTGKIYFHDGTDWGVGPSIFNASDTNIVARAANHFLAFDGTNWVNRNITISDIDDIGTLNLGDLNDINISSPQDNQILRYNFSSGKWENVDLVSIITDDLNLNDLSNVTTSAATDNELLAYDAATSEWINQTKSEAGFGNSSVLDITGVDNLVVSGTTGTAGNLLEWNADGDAVDSGLPTNTVLDHTKLVNTLVGGTNVTLSYSPNTITINGPSNEQIQDTAWSVLGGTQTLITVTYDDANNSVDFIVNDDLSLYDNTISGFLTSVDFSDINGTVYITSAETFSDVDTQLMTAAAIDDLIESKGYITSETDNQTLSWNGTTGELTISNGNTVDIDGRYLQNVDLGSSYTSNLVTITNTGGNNVTLNAATTTTAGVMTASDKTKLDGIEVGAEANTVDSVNGQTGVVVLDTDDISEGTTNLYFTTTRANAAIDNRVDKVFVDALNVDADTLDGYDSLFFIDWPNQNGSPTTFNTYQDLVNTAVSSGVVSGCAISDNGDGTVDIASGTAMIRDTSSRLSDLYTVELPAQTGVTLTDNSINYIYVDWNSGSPQLSVGISDSDFNCIDKCLAYVVHREGTVLDILDARQQNVDADARLRSYLFETNRFARAGNGSLIGNINRYLTLTSGKFYFMLAKIEHSTFDTSVAGTNRLNVFEYYYRDGVGGWTTIPDQKQIDNTQYDDGSGTLATLSGNKYGVHWVYLILDDEPTLEVIYGQGDYNYSGALNSNPPATIPDRILTMGILVGRVIIRSGETSPTNVESTLNGSFSLSQVESHNDLSGLQGGTINEYYHLDGTDYTRATTFLDGGSLTHTGIESSLNNKLSTVSSDTTLNGDGTVGSPLSVNEGNTFLWTADHTWSKSDPKITLDDTDLGGRSYSISSNGGELLVTDDDASANRIKMSSDGKISIGDDNPPLEAKLFVRSSSSSSGDSANVDIRARAGSQESTVEVQRHDFDSSLKSAWLQYTGETDLGLTYLDTAIDTHDSARLVFQGSSSAAIYTSSGTTFLAFGIDDVEKMRLSSTGLNVLNDGELTVNGNAVLTTADEGSGNGLDADTLDGQDGSYYLDYNNFTNTPTYDNYVSWALWVDGASQAAINSGEEVNFVGGSNITLSYSATNNTVTIDATTAGEANQNAFNTVGVTTAGQNDIVADDPNDTLIFDAGANGLISYATDAVTDTLTIEVNNDLSLYDNSTSGFLSTVTFSDIDGGAYLTSAEAFSDVDTQLMTAAAINDLIESKSYITSVNSDVTLTGDGAGSPLGVDTSHAFTWTNGHTFQGSIDLAASSTQSRSIEIGQGRTGNGFSYIDLVGDATHSDFGTRLIRRDGGANTETQLQHRGTGTISIDAVDLGKINMTINGSSALHIDDSRNVSINSTTASERLDVNGNTAAKKYIGKDSSNVQQFEMVYNESTESVDFNFL